MKNHQKKHMSQVFLKESWPCKKVAEYFKDLNVRKILEIGPGGGILTQELVSADFSVTAVEKDPYFAGKINDTLPTVQIIEADILRFDFDAWIHESHNPVGICGNIPYHISTPILSMLLKLLEKYPEKIKGIALLVQLEFAQRLVSAPSSKSYGSLSVYTQLRADVRLECKVERQLFHPVPKVDSAIITLKALKERLPEQVLLNVERITKQAFTQRRKILLNSLALFLKDHDKSVLQNLPIDFSRRCDSLNIKEFVQIAELLM